MQYLKKFTFSLNQNPLPLVSKQHDRRRAKRRAKVEVFKEQTPYFSILNEKPLQCLLFKGSMPERLMGVDCKSTSFTYAGSNPARSIQFLNVFWFEFYE